MGTEPASLAGRPSAGDRDVLDGEVHAGGSPASTLASGRACCGERFAGEGLPAGVLPATAWAGRKGVGGGPLPPPTLAATRACHRGRRRGGSPAGTPASGHVDVLDVEVHGEGPMPQGVAQAIGESNGF